MGVAGQADLAKHPFDAATCSMIDVIFNPGHYMLELLRDYIVLSILAAFSEPVMHLEIDAASW